METGEHILLGQFYRELKLVNGETFIQPCFWINDPKPKVDVEETSKVMFSIHKVQIIDTTKNPRKMAVTTARIVLEDGSLATEGFVNYDYLLVAPSALYNQLANLEWTQATFTKSGSYQFKFNGDVYFDIKKLEKLNKLLGNRLNETDMALLLADITEHLLKLGY